jgi:hypothetical protein
MLARVERARELKGVCARFKKKDNKLEYLWLVIFVFAADPVVVAVGNDDDTSYKGVHNHNGILFE